MSKLIFIIAVSVSSVLSIAFFFRGNSTINQITSNKNIDVECVLKRENVSKNTPIILDCIFTNKLSEPVLIDLGAKREEKFDISVTEPDQRIIKLPPLQKEGIGIVGEFWINSSQIYKQQLILNKWYDFNQIGKYDIKIDMIAPARTEENKSVTVKLTSNLSLYVEPENLLEIEVLIKSYFDILMTNDNSLDDNLNAANSLSYIKNPLAVYYIEKVINERPEMGSVLISGLERISGEEAINSLQRLTKSRNKMTSMLAQNSLNSIAYKNNSEQVPK